MNITAVGLDIAKNVFQVHGADAVGKSVVRKKLKRDQVLAYFSTLPPCLVGMEACASAHHWARKLQELGHSVKLIAPQFVKPYVKTNKNDAKDAEAIWEALTRPNMRFVAIKSVEQQAVLALHTARRGVVKARTAQANQIRGLLGEFGLVIAQGIRNVFTEVPVLLEDAVNDLPGSLRVLIEQQMEHLRQLDARSKQLELQIQQWHRQNPLSKRLAEIPGIGPLTASAFIASTGDAKNFADGRQVASWMGLVPKQHSSGGKQTLLGISKRGDVYLRTLFVHGARSVVKVACKQPAPQGRARWVAELAKRRGPNVAAVALANKNARTAWALLAHDREFSAGYGCR
jgi:transposase